ncbi:MAG: 4'-phosphopantetheinyl transferase superfamily protein [Muribaculaceae bacterium]|nr:4'-phosphopantetheinyl transferase superfamily protein [Muribaculaceae bacterium]
MGEFMYEREMAPCGIAIEEIYGAEEKSAKVWKLFAMQIFSEAEGDYREIEHLENGAPLLDGIPQRISVSHTSHCLVVASLPKTPDIELSSVNPRTALGIDLEKADRAQVLKIKDRFLCEDELKLLPALEDIEKATVEEVEKYILAWTCKEAIFKAAMGEAYDWKNDYRILSLPKLATNISEATAEKFGKATVLLPGTEPHNMELLLSSWRLEEHIVTLAFSNKIAKFPNR